MALPVVVWRNPKAVKRRRLWNRARHLDNQRVYVVVRSGFGADSEWEGMPNLVMIDGGGSSHARNSARFGRFSCRGSV